VDPGGLSGIGRNQFILGPRRPNGFVEWTTREIGEGLWLTTHPSMQVEHRTEDSNWVTLLGFALDPYDPLATDEILTERLASAAAHGFSDLEGEELTRLGGRWLLIVKNEEGQRLYTDALGLRQVVYSISPVGDERWCASHADLIAKVEGQSEDSQVLEFLDRWDRKADKEYWIPGDVTNRRGIRHLLPNHYLDLEDWKPIRFWPHGPLPTYDPERIVADAAAILRGTMEGAARRFDLVLLLTAGWDSRILLAASRAIKDHLRCMTLRKGRMDENHQDLAVPLSLTRRLGIDYEIVTAPDSPSPDFRDALTRHVPLAHPVWMPDLETCRGYFKGSAVAVHSGGSEVAKCFYRQPRLSGSFPLPHRLAILINMYRDPLAIRELSKWTKDLPGTHRGLDPHDLLYWEQRAGRWLPSSLLEADFAWRDALPPFNNRQLLSTLLGAPSTWRLGPGFRLYRALIEELWPDTLSEPINPQKRVASARGGLGYWRSELTAALRFFKQDLHRILTRGSAEP